MGGIVNRSRLSTAVVAGLIAASVVGSGTADAEPLPPGCQSQFWLHGGLLGRGVTRYICDGPVEADGGWMRTRIFHDPAYVAPGRTICSGGTWSSSCTHYPPYRVEEFFEKEAYRVTPATVLPDEPGHIA